MPVGAKLISGIKTFGERFSAMYRDARKFHKQTIDFGTEEGLRRAQLSRKGKIGTQLSIFSSIIKNAGQQIERDLIGVKNLPKDVSAAWKDGNKVTEKAAKTYQKGIKPHLPGILAYAGTITPLPGAQPAGYVLGQFVKYLT